MIATWLKIVHVVAVITWIGGMLTTAIVLRASTMSPAPFLPHEKRLLVTLRQWESWVTSPAMLLVWACGLALASMGGWFGQHWLSLKLALVFGLSAFHGVQSGMLRRVLAPEVRSIPSWWRFGGVALVLAAGCIVALVIGKPF